MSDGNIARKKFLLQLLVDQKALDADRDDAAMDLGEEFDDNTVLTVLYEIAKNPIEIDMILNSCGEAIGKIWVKKEIFNTQIYHSLLGTARYGVYTVLKSRRPDWIERYELGKDKFA